MLVSFFTVQNLSTYSVFMQVVVIYVVYLIDVISFSNVVLVRCFNLELI